MNSFDWLCLMFICFWTRWGKAWHDAACQILQNLKSVSWPFFAIHGDADEISDVKFSQKMFNTASSQDKEIKVLTYLNTHAFISFP